LLLKSNSNIEIQPFSIIIIAISLNTVDNVLGFPVIIFGGYEILRIFQDIILLKGLKFLCQQLNFVLESKLYPYKLLLQFLIKYFMVITMLIAFKYIDFFSLVRMKPLDYILLSNNMQIYEMKQMELFLFI